MYNIFKKIKQYLFNNFIIFIDVCRCDLNTMLYEITKLVDIDMAINIIYYDNEGEKRIKHGKSKLIVVLFDNKINYNLKISHLLIGKKILLFEKKCFKRLPIYCNLRKAKEFNELKINENIIFLLRINEEEETILKYLGYNFIYLKDEKDVELYEKILLLSKNYQKICIIYTNSLLLNMILKNNIKENTLSIIRINSQTL